MNRTLTIAALLLTVGMGITACASPAETELPESSTSDGTQGPVTPESKDSDEAEQPGTSAEREYTMPDGARPGSTDFAFPVPKDWPELVPFAEEKIGKDLAMSASFEFPGDAKSAAAAYKQLLEQAGYEIHPNPLGEQVHDASFIAKGQVGGVDYAGTLDFNTDAAGTQDVMINLTED